MLNIIVSVKDWHFRLNWFIPDITQLYFWIFLKEQAVMLEEESNQKVNEKYTTSLILYFCNVNISVSWPEGSLCWMFCPATMQAHFADLLCSYFVVVLFVYLSDCMP